MQTLKIKSTFPAKVRPVIESKKRWLILKGGRGSAKSWTVANLFIDRTLADGKPRLCTRNVQKSITESVYALIIQKIKDRGLSKYFDIQANSIQCYNGGRFIFRGMNDLQSLEGIQDVWIEEGQNATEERVLELNPTIRSDGSQIFVSYNPKFDDDYIHVIATDPAYKDHRTVVEINWRDNPWFPGVLNEERLLMKSINLDLYNHIWEGQTLKQIEGAIIKAKYFGRYNVLPTLRNVIIVADTAAEVKEQSDYTVYLLGGIGIDGNIYLMDMYRGKIESIERIQKAKDFWNKHKRRMGYGVGATSFLVEKAISGFDLIQHLRADRSINVGGITRKKQKSGIAGKFGRLMDVIEPIAAGKVYVPDGDIFYADIRVTDGAWVDDFMRECQAFTYDDSHDYDDQVDTLIDMVARLDSGDTSTMEALIA